MIHIHTGPRHRNRATPGFIAAVTALREGHRTDIFLAGDEVHPMAPAIIAAPEGQGTGKRADHLTAIRNPGGRLHVPRLSSQARGYAEAMLAGWPATFATPASLIALSLAADTVLCS